MEDKSFYAFESGIISKRKQGKAVTSTLDKQFKISTSKQILQRLPIALAQVQAHNNPENLLNKIGKIVYSLYQSKEINKKVYNNMIKSK